MTRENLHLTLQAAVRFVESAEEGFLILGWRNRIWDALMDDCEDTSLFRWQALGCLVAFESLDKWSREEAVPPEQADLPQRALKLAIATVLGEVTRRHAESQSYLLERELEGLRFCQVNWDSFAPEICLVALQELVAWGPEALGEYDADDEDSDVRDVHYLACYDYCGSPPWEAERKRAYWLHWLNDLFLEVLNPPKEIHEILNKKRADLD